MQKMLCYITIKGNIKTTVAIVNNRVLFKQETICRPAPIGGAMPCKRSC